MHRLVPVVQNLLVPYQLVSPAVHPQQSILLPSLTPTVSAWMAGLELAEFAFEDEPVWT